MRNVIVEITGRAVYARGRRGFCNFQDVYLVANGEQVIPSDYRMGLPPDGCIEQCAILPSSKLLLSGWAADLSLGGAVTDVQLWIDGKMMARTVQILADPTSRCILITKLSRQVDGSLSVRRQRTSKQLS